MSLGAGSESLSFPPASCTDSCVPLRCDRGVLLLLLPCCPSYRDGRYPSGTYAETRCLPLVALSSGVLSPQQ